jgi:hypothetical protein
MRLGIASVLVVGACQVCSAQAPPARPNLDVAEYTAAGELVFPADADQWIHLGSAIGHGYSEPAFVATDPGTIHVVQIEPAAYRHLLEHKQYADGTMLLLSFYDTGVAPEPELNGFVQGELSAREIHVVDRGRFGEERAFFLFPPGVNASAAVPAPNQCLTCHAEHGRFDSTFTQFYPPIRDLVDAAP